MRGAPFLTADFSGGLNVRDSAANIADNQAQAALNVVSSSRGKLRKRYGCSSFVTSATNNFNDVFAFEALTTGPLLMCTDRNHLYSVNAAGTKTTLYTVPASGNFTLPLEFAAFTVNGVYGPLFYVSAGSTPAAWDGVTAAPISLTATSGNVPKGAFIKSMNNRLWIAGIPAATGYTPGTDPPVDHAPSTLVFSAIGDARNWPAANVVEFDPHDGDAITGLGTLGPYLLVFKQRKTWLVYDLDTGANRRLGGDVGCVGHRTIAEAPFGTFFLSEDQGVCLATPTGVTPNVSEPVQPYLDGASANYSAQAGSTFGSGYFHRHYYLSIPYALSNDLGTEAALTLDYDSDLKSWWVHTAPYAGSPVRQFAVSHLSGGAAELYAADGNEIAKCFTSGLYTDIGASFVSYWQGPWQSPTYFRRRIFQSPWFRKRMWGIRAEGTGTVNLSIGKDFSTSAPTLVRTNIFSAASAVTQARFASLGVANAFSLRFARTDPSPFEVDSYTLLMEDRRD